MLDLYAALNYGRTTADSAQTEQTAAGDQDAEQDPEAGQGTASAASKTITAGGGEPVSLGW